MQDKYKIVKIRERNKYLEVYWGDNHISKFHFLWLRDNCPTAFHKDTRMRKFNILSVTINIKPIDFRFTNKSLYISWSENNHNSIYNLKWIRDNCYTEINLKSYKSKPFLFGLYIFYNFSKYIAKLLPIIGLSDLSIISKNSGFFSMWYSSSFLYIFTKKLVSCDFQNKHLNHQ